MSPSPAPRRLWAALPRGLGGLVTGLTIALAVALAVVWACGAQPQQRAPRGDGASTRPGPASPAPRRVRPRTARLPAVNACDEARRSGTLTPLDADGKPKPSATPDRVPRFSFGTAQRGKIGRQADEAELWYMTHPDGACLEVYLDDKLQGRINTRSLPRPKPGARPAPRPKPRPKRPKLRRVARLDLEATDTGRRRLQKTPTGRFWEARRLRFRRGRHQIELRPVGRGTLRLFGVVLKRRRRGVVVHNLGVPGAQVANVSPGHKALIKAQLKRLRPDLLLMMLGTNDAFDRGLTAKRFERRLTKLLQRLRGKRRKPACLLLGAPDFGSKKWRTARRLRKKAAMVRKVQRKVAKAEGCAYWDVFAAMGGAGAIRRLIRARPRLAYRDRVHLTRRGYRALGDLIHEELMRRYAAYLKPRFKRLKLEAPQLSAEALKKQNEERRNWPAGMGPTPFVDAKGKALDGVFRRLVLLQRKARRGRLRVVVMGDSHTSGDSLAGQLRLRLQTQFGDSGHGYLHVGKPWIAYRHRHVRYRIQGPWKYYFILTWNKPEQPRDWLYGAGGVSSWIKVPVPPPPPRSPNP